MLVKPLVKDDNLSALFLLRRYVVERQSGIPFTCPVVGETGTPTSPQFESPFGNRTHIVIGKYRCTPGFAAG
jgi:hypothetical protein